MSYILEMLEERGAADAGAQVARAFRAVSLEVVCCIAESPADLSLRSHGSAVHSDRHLGEITYEGLCRAATASYLARLARLRLLVGPVGLIGERVYAQIATAEKILQASAGRQPATARFFQRVGERWVEISRQLHAPTQRFQRRVPFPPPWFRADVRAALAHALRAGRLRAAKQGLVTTDKEVIVSYGA